MTTTAVLVEDRRNLVPTPQPIGSTAPGWARRSGTGGATTAEVVAPGGSGWPPGVLTAMRVTWTTAPTAVGGGLQVGSAAGQAGPIAVTAGQQVTASLYVRPSRAANMAAAFIFQDAAGATVSGGTYGTTTAVAAGVATRLSVTNTVPVGAVRALVIADARTGTPWAVGDWVEGSALLVEVGSQPGSYFDGDTPDTPPTFYSWGGAVGFSPSVAQRIEQRTTDVVTPAGAFRGLSSRVWTLGDPDRPDVAFNGIDGYGVEWVIADPRGWYSSPPVELGMEDKGTDGAWFGRGAYKARVLEISGAFRVCSGGADALDAAAERLQDALDPTRDTLLAVTEQVPKQLTVRPSGEVAVDPVAGQPRVRRFSFVLTAGDPFKYAAGAAGLTEVELTLRNPAAEPGVAHPLAHPLNHGGAPADGGGRRAVDNIGQLPVSPVLRIVGPASKPVLTNATTGESFGIGRDLLYGEQVVVDVDLRTVLISGASDTRAIAPRSTFWRLARGVNDIRFTAAAYDPAARAYIAFRPRWK